MKSKVLLVLIFVSVLNFIGCSGSIQEHQPVLVDLEIINYINNYKDELKQEAGKFKKVQRVIELSSRKGELTALFNESEEIKKMTFTFYEDRAKKSTEYVFQNNDYLLYVNENVFEYNTPSGIGESGFVQTVNSELYFAENKLVYWVKNKINVPSEVYPNKSAQIFTKLGEILQTVSSN